MDIVHEVADELDADILAYFGDIERPRDDDLIKMCKKRTRRKNVVLILTTRGGDPNAAYRLARCLQRTYSPTSGSKPLGKKPADEGKFVVFVNSVCKSAGTIIALGADKIYMTEHAELGPIDVQLRKPDEVGERTSGLTPIQSMQFLENQSSTLFRRHFTQLRFDTTLAFSTKMAAEIATNMTIGLLSPIYEQIDPIRLAEVDRSLRISLDYGERLSRNLQDGALVNLVSRYPSHGFVIDREEAKEIFNEVEEPPEKLFLLGEAFKALSDDYVDAGGRPFLMFLNDKPRDNAKEADHVEKNDAGQGLRVDGGAEPEAGPRARRAKAQRAVNGAEAAPNDGAGQPEADG